MAFKIVLRWKIRETNSKKCVIITIEINLQIVVKRVNIMVVY